MDVDQEEWTGIELTATPVATASSVAATTDGLVSSTQELDINRSDDTSGPFLRYNAMLAVLKHTLYMHVASPSFSAAYKSSQTLFVLATGVSTKTDRRSTVSRATCLHNRS